MKLFQEETEETGEKVMICPTQYFSIIPKYLTFADLSILMLNPHRSDVTIYAVTLLQENSTQEDKSQERTILLPPSSSSDVKKTQES